MGEKIRVMIDGQEKFYDQGISYEEIAKEYQERFDGQIALVSVNGKIRELFKRLKRDCELSFFTLKDNIGYQTYVRTATMLFLKAVNDVFGREDARKCRVEFAIGDGIFICPWGILQASEENAKRIEQRMGELVEKKLPFWKRS